jgi:hypothetical protein
LQDIDREVTDDEAGEVAEGEEAEIGDVTEIGESVTKGGADDPEKKNWTRIKGMPTDPRTEEHQNTTFRNLRVRRDTQELEIFLALLPLSPESMLQIVRDGTRKAGQNDTWKEDVKMLILSLRV